MSTELVLERAADDFENQIFTWEDLNQLLARRSVAPADLQLSQNGVVLPRSAYSSPDGVLDLRRLTELVRDGASIIVDGLDRVNDRVREVTTDIMRLTGETASCNIFVTFHDSQAFHSHFDEVDTVIVQLEGTKHWQVHGPSEADPLPEYGDSDPRNCPAQLLLETTLNPGDVLHVPRGWWHTVRGAGGRSLHATFAFTRKTGFDFVRWIAWRALSDEAIRQSLDRWGSVGSRSRQQREILAAFTRAAESLSIDDFFAEETANADGWQSASLPWSVTDDELPDDLNIRVLSVFDPPLQVDGHVVRFTFAGSLVTLPAAYEPAIRSLFQMNACTLNQVVEASGVPRRAAEGLVRQLQSLGLIELGNRAEERPA